MNIKNEIDRVIDAPLINDNEYTTLVKSNNLTEEQKYTIKKVQMRHELSFKDTVDEEQLNECLQLYHDGKKQVTNVINYYELNRTPTNTHNHC